MIIPSASTDITAVDTMRIVNSRLNICFIVFFLFFILSEFPFRSMIVYNENVLVFKINTVISAFKLSGKGELYL